MREAGNLPDAVVITNGSYLFEAMLALGPIRFTGDAGRRAADWPEITSFMQATGRISEPWEAEALYRMCGAFLSGLTVGENPLGIFPEGE